MSAVSLALLMLTIASQASPGSPPASSIAAPAGESEKLSKARALTEVLAPAEFLLASNMKAWETGLLSALKLDPGVTKLEESHPGIVKAGIEAARPAGKRYCTDFVGKLAAYRSRLISEQLTIAEIDAALVQFRTPAWRRFVTSMASKIDFREMAQITAKRAVETGIVTLKQEEANKTVQSAARESGRDLAADDQLEIMRLTQTDVARKLVVIATQTDRQALEWANNLDPALIQEQNSLLTAGMLAYADARRK